MDANLQRSADAETQYVRRSVRAHERRTALPFRQRGTSGQQVGGGRAASAGIGSGAAKSAGAGQLTTATSAWKAGTGTSAPVVVASVRSSSQVAQVDSSCWCGAAA